MRETYCPVDQPHSGIAAEFIPTSARQGSIVTAVLSRRRGRSARTPERALLVPDPLSSAAVQELDLHRLRSEVRLDPFPRRGPHDGLPRRNEPDELGLGVLLAGRHGRQ